MTARWHECAETSAACLAFCVVAWLLDDRGMVGWFAGVGVLAAIAALVLSDHGDEP